MINLEFLASLQDMDLVEEFAWGEHILSDVMKEVAVFQDKKRLQATNDKHMDFQISSCLPMLAIIYMDHLDIPTGLANQHVIDYSLPRIRFVCQNDFTWVDKIDRNKLTLSQPFYGKHTQFRRLSDTPYWAAPRGEANGGESMGGDPINAQENKAQANEEDEVNLSASLNVWLHLSLPSSQDLMVPAQFQALYEKHKEVFAAEVDNALQKVAQGLKELQCHHTAALLRDVAEAITSSSTEPHVTFTVNTTAEAPDKVSEDKADADVATGDQDTTANVNMSEDVGAEVEKENIDIATNVANNSVQEGVAIEVTGNASPHNPPLYCGAPRSVTAGLWDDCSTFELFQEGTEEFEWFHTISPAKSALSPVPAEESPVPVEETPAPVKESPVPVEEIPVIATPDAPAAATNIVVVSSGPDTHEKKNRHKRQMKVPAGILKAKRPKVNLDTEEIYEKYIMHGKALRRLKKGELPKHFVKIGGFHISYRRFLATLKPRADMGDEVMSLYIEMFNIAAFAADKRGPRKFIFSVFMSTQLIKDPAKFQPNVVMPELVRAITRFRIQKSDLLFFPIVDERHWVVTCANLLHKQWNTFDSVTGKGKTCSLQKQANNLITNFTTLTEECEEFNLQVASFNQHNLDDYPKKQNLCDCGFFGLLYIQNFDGKVVKEFSKDYLPDFRKLVAAQLFNHPLNDAKKEEAFLDDLAP